MQAASVRQSLLLWAVCSKQQADQSADIEGLERIRKKVERYLMKAHITKVETLATILDYYTLKYTQSGEDKIIQFDYEEIEQISLTEFSFLQKSIN